jgi:caa(3)-type oxidase subunit IV
MENINYKEEYAGYWKILIGLLVLTAVTFVQPHYFLQNATFGVQMLIGLAKAWLILMYYMHLKGETLIGWTVIFSIILVIVFFVIVGLDVNSFQFMEESHIISGDAAASHSHGAAHAESAHH